MAGLVSLRVVGRAVVVDSLGHRLLAVAFVEERTVEWKMEDLEGLSTVVEVDLEEGDEVERMRIHRRSIGLSRGVTLAEEHCIVGSYFEVDRGWAGGGQATRQVAAVGSEVCAGYCEERACVPDRVEAIDRIVRTLHTHPRSRCRRRGSATRPTQTAPGSTVPAALFADLGQRPHGTGLVSSEIGWPTCDLGRVQDVECDFGCSVADGQALRRSSPVWNRHSRRSMGGSWGRMWALLVKRVSVGRSNECEGYGVRLQARMAFSW